MASIVYVSFKNFSRFIQVETVGSVDIVSDSGNFVGSVLSPDADPTEAQCGFIFKRPILLQAGHIMYIQAKQNLDVDALMFVNFNDTRTLTVTGHNNFGLRFDSDFGGDSGGSFRPVDNQMATTQVTIDPVWRDYRMTVNMDGSIAFAHRVSTGLGSAFDPTTGNAWVDPGFDTSVGVSGDWTTKPAYFIVWTSCQDRLFHVDEFHWTNDGIITRPAQDELGTSMVPKLLKMGQM